MSFYKTIIYKKYKRYGYETCQNYLILHSLSAKNNPTIKHFKLKKPSSSLIIMLNITKMGH